MSQPHCLDSGVFINSWRKNHPHDLFPALWDRLGDLLVSGKAFLPRVVFEEIEAGGDDLFEWLKRHKSAVRDPDPKVIGALQAIMQHPHHQRLVQEQKSRSGADPFVIAHAQAAGAIVVTEEQERKSPEMKPRIPDVCKVLNVPCIRTVDFFRACKICFR